MARFPALVLALMPPHQGRRMAWAGSGKADVAATAPLRAAPLVQATCGGGDDGAPRVLRACTTFIIIGWFCRDHAT
jgi:hypothetical protein